MQLIIILAKTVLSVNVFRYKYLVNLSLIFLLDYGLATMDFRYLYPAHFSFDVCFGLGVGNNGFLFLFTFIHI